MFRITVYYIVIFRNCLCLVRVQKHTVMSLSKASQGKKRKHMSLSLNNKLCTIEKPKKEGLCQAFVRNMGLQNRLSWT